MKLGRISLAGVFQWWAEITGLFWGSAGFCFGGLVLNDDFRTGSGTTSMEEAEKP